ncbi:MAG TPA: ABC transporter permease [Candidatus Limnocylindria bacterium]|jgi:NitT/TauT family transport system permease protein|nr:ABC transporter permease [Candidatus Limnocylindria bacterium]
MAERAERPAVARVAGEAPTAASRAPHAAAVVTTPLPRRSLFQQHEQLFIGVLTVVAFVVVWQLVANARIWSKLFLPGPSDIVVAFGELVAEGELAQDLAVSGQEFVIGYAIAAVIGIVLGLVLGWYRRARYALDPFITFFYATPRIVLLPLIIIWVGIGIESKIWIVFLGAFFAVLINTMAGVRSLDENLLRVARSFGATQLDVFRTIALPGSVPFILTGLRLATGHALIGIVVGEIVGAPHGIGRMMWIAGQTFQSARMFVGLFFLAGTGVVLTYALQKLERHFDAWRPQR